MTDDDLLRDLYRVGTAPAGGAPSDCPVTHERMVALLEGRLARRERLDTMRLILDHPGCHAEFAMLRAVWEAAGGTARRPRAAPRLLRAAAVIVVLVGAAALATTLGRGRREEPMRGRGTTIELVAPQGAVGGSGILLVWHPLPGTSRYEAVIADSGGMPVLSRTTSDTGVAVAALAPGSYRWWVRATRRDGTTERSAIQAFTVSR